MNSLLKVKMGKFQTFSQGSTDSDPLSNLDFSSDHFRKELLKVRSVKDKGDEEITVKKAAEYMACIHGTYWKAWEDMKQKGISRLGRNHIHFSSGMLSKDGVGE